MATNYVRAKYSEIIDVQTNNNGVTCIGIHTPTGGAPLRMLFGFYRQFRKFRYRGCQVRIQPTTTLPADPLGVSYSAGDRLIDPREMINPILFHGCHGESMNEALDIAYKGTGVSPSTILSEFPASEDFRGDELGSDNFKQGDFLYYSALSDRGFRKFLPQVGGKLPFLKPLVWNLGADRPIVPHACQPDSGQMSNSDPFVSSPGQESNGGDSIRIQSVLPRIDGAQIPVNLMTTGVRPLGWLPTYQLWTAGPDGDDKAAASPSSYSYLPKIFMGMLILAPSYRVEQYYRIYIDHYFEFSHFSTALGTGVGYTLDNEGAQDILLGASGPAYARLMYRNLYDTPAEALDAALVNEDTTVEVLGGDAMQSTAGVS